MQICNGCIYRGRKTDNAHFWCGFDDRVRTFQEYCINFKNDLQMSDFKFQGKIVAVAEKRLGVSSTGNTWAVQEYTIQEEADNYPMSLTFEVFGEEKIAAFNIKLDEVLTIHFRMDSREYKDRRFNSIRAWKVERTPAEQPAEQPVIPTKVDNDDKFPF